MFGLVDIWPSVDESERKRFFEAAVNGDLPLLKSNDGCISLPVWISLQYLRTWPWFSVFWNAWAELADEFLILGLTIEKITDSGDITALHYAAKKGHRHVCKYLVEEVNLNIDVRDDFGRTPLHYACLSKNCVTAAYLLQRGANPNAKTIMWRTPLHHAVEESI